MANDMGSSPHTRGALVASRYCTPDEGIIPAYAGSTGLLCNRSVSFRDHPRIRGEHSSASFAAISLSGSSPHTRGALLFSDIAECGVGIIPTYAGSTVQ